MKANLIFLISSIAALCSCSQIDDPVVNRKEEIQVKMEDDATLLINNYVLPSEINRILPKISEVKSRAGISFDVTVLHDESNNPLIYCVNFDDNQGFILLSGTKKFSPVLAYSYNGHFNIDEPIPPVEFWLEGMSNQIKHKIDLPNDSVREYYLQWNSLLFESSIDKLSQKISYSRGEGDVTPEELMRLTQIVKDYRMKLEGEGHPTYSIMDDVTRDSQWSKYVQQLAAESIYPLYDHLWEDLSFIVEYDYSNIVENPNYLETIWQQEGGFNRYFPLNIFGNNHPVGCGPLAVGQIMYHHRYPNSYNWHDMNTIYATSETASFLYEVAKKCKAIYKEDPITKKSTTLTHIDDLAGALRSYGYNAEVRDHTAIPMNISRSSTNRPVIMTGHYMYNQGTSEEKQVGHAWIATSTRRFESQHYYAYMTLTERYTINTIAETDKTVNYGSHIYFVWGWGGLYDGFYRDDILSSPSGGGRIFDRKDIVNIYPLNN